MKNFVHLPCDNQAAISDELYNYLHDYTDTVTGNMERHVCYTDAQPLIEHCPLLRTYLHSLELSDPKIVHVNRCNTDQRLHIDEHPLICMMFPVRNCVGTTRTYYYELENMVAVQTLSKFGVPYYELKYDSIKELDSYELSSPVMMNPNVPHHLKTIQPVLPDYRIAVRFRFYNDPQHFLL